MNATTPVYPTCEDIRLLDPAFYQAPYPKYQWMRDNAPVYWDATDNIWGITRYEDIHYCSMRPEIFCSGKNTRPTDTPIPSMINTDEPKHRQRRGVIKDRFTMGYVPIYEAFIRDAVSYFIDQICEQGQCDFVNDVAKHIPMLMIGKLMDLPIADYQKLLHWSDLFATGTTEDLDPEGIQEIIQAVGDYDAYIMAIINARRQQPGEDILSDIASAEIDGCPLRHEELMHESMLVLVGGDETTRHVMSGGLHALLTHPAQYEALWQNPGLLPNAIEEMLRWVTPVKNMVRTATQDTEVNGQAIAEGDKLLLLYDAGNRDERVIGDPNTFNIQRNLKRHMAFGGFGNHLCLGNHLARLEITVLFQEVMRRLPDIQLASDAPPPFRYGNFVLGFEELAVTFTPSAPEKRVTSLEALKAPLPPRGR
ncbi:MAG: cytochrome P450 [Pseudomonadota bacterium]